MAILIANDGDKIVATIAERNAITKKFDGMKVTVNDAIADVLVGGGQAGYEWSENQNKWLLTFKTTTDNLTFITESKVVASGKATATNFPQDGIVWDCFVLDSNNIVVAEFSAPVVNGNEIQLGSSAYDGQTLKFTYGFGSIQAAVSLALAENKGVTSYNDLTDKPVIPSVPTALSSFTNDVGFQSTVYSQRFINFIGALKPTVGTVRLTTNHVSTIRDMSVSVSSASSSAITVDVFKNGVSVLNGSLLTIPVGNYKSAILSGLSIPFSSTDYITASIITASNGSDLAVSITLSQG
jgi:hypothetical protein